MDIIEKIMKVFYILGGVLLVVIGFLSIPFFTAISTGQVGAQIAKIGTRLLRKAFGDI